MHFKQQMSHYIVQLQLRQVQSVKIRGLDGFIAEQYHAQTFNLNAEATGSQYRAKVLEPNGNGYAKTQ